MSSERALPRSRRYGCPCRARFRPRARRCSRAAPHDGLLAIEEIHQPVSSGEDQVSGVEPTTLPGSLGGFPRPSGNAEEAGARVIALGADQQFAGLPVLRRHRDVDEAILHAFRRTTDAGAPKRPVRVSGVAAAPPVSVIAGLDDRDSGNAPRGGAVADINAGAKAKRTRCCRSTSVTGSLQQNGGMTPRQCTTVARCRPRTATSGWRESGRAAPRRRRAPSCRPRCSRARSCETFGSGVRLISRSGCSSATPPLSEIPVPRPAENTGSIACSPLACRAAEVNSSAHSLLSSASCATTFVWHGGMRLSVSIRRTRPSARPSLPACDRMPPQQVGLRQPSWKDNSSGGRRG